MYRESGQLHFSPTDLTRYMESPFASWMDRLSIEFPDQAPKRDPVDALMSSLAQKGFEHEDSLQSAFAAQGLAICNVTGASTTEKAALTLEAMHLGVDVIVQARLELEPFGGYADFLVKVAHTHGSKPCTFGNWHYEVWDTKLASKSKPAFIIQLCCYAMMLESIQGCLPEYITLALGNGETERLKTRNYFYYYKTLKDSFIEDHGRFDPHQQPDPANSGYWADWSGYAESVLLDKDHLFQVATITTAQITKLNRAGIHTMQALADAGHESVPGINPAIFAKLKAQATIQKRSEAREIPHFEILLPEEEEQTGLTLLPPHSPLDVFFDIEGNPLDEGGLEYLWGNTYFDENGDRQFIDFWAHNSEQEKRCFQEFIHWVYKRWQRDPSMHIYHYANYEIAACRKLMGRYGVCEYEMDQLLRNEVFVDLYKVVKGGVLLGEPRYSIKNVEHLYRGKRETEVGSGGDSVVVYEQWRELNQQGEQGDTWQTSKILSNIRDYNRDDCDSTQELVDWLRQQQTAHGIRYLGKTEVNEPDEKEEVTERTQLRDRLLERALSERKTNPEQAAVTENLAWILEFHRREAKPMYWRLFERLGLSHSELLDDADCLACCKRTEREPFKPKPRARNLAYEYRFDPSQEFKGAQKQFYLLGVETEEGKTAKISFLREESNLDNGLIVVQSKEEPPSLISLVPDEAVNPNPIPQAIDDVVGDYENGQLISRKSAIVDFLMRVKPRIAGQDDGPIAPSHEPAEKLQQIIHAISHLDNSYLTIQGPPGTGKSYTGMHVIAELMKSGARVGIASNSHKAIVHLLLNVARHCKNVGIAATFACTRDEEPELSDYDVAIVQNKNLPDLVQDACVVGTTAWGFAREDMAGQLDFLFVDEAGQVAVANLIAMSRSAANLVLMGDQMQLGQPLQGTHPADSGLS
ncbi:MAG: TM0106 family RecB-like putative nuclease, partial [Granulosicoccus sp.]